MESSVRSGKWWKGSLLIGGMAILVALVFALSGPHEPLLTAVAHPVMAMEGSEEICWISNKQLLIVKRDLTNPSQHKYWHGAAELLNVETGVRTPLPGLTKLINGPTQAPIISPLCFQLSPDGDWLSWTKIGEDTRISPQMAHLDGSGYHHWEREGLVSYSYLGAHSLVSVSLLDPKVALHNPTDAAQDRQYATAAQAKETLRDHAAPYPFYRTVTETRPDADGNRVQIATYRTEDRVDLELANFHRTPQGPSPSRTQVGRLPQGATLERGQISPKEQAILYDLTAIQSPAFMTWQNRFFPRIPIHRTYTQGLWVSDMEGRGMHEIGHVPNYPDANGDTTPKLSRVMWLPDGKQVSFVYHHKFYVAPAEIAK